MAERTLKRDELRNYVGQRLGASAWHEVTQEQVGLFADATGDHQWIHVDPARAAAASSSSALRDSSTCRRCASNLARASAYWCSHSSRCFS